MNASRRPADTRFNRASPLRLAELAKLPPAVLKRYRVEIDFAADGERDTFTWTGTVAGESEAFEAAFDALAADYGAPDDIADTRIALA